MPADACEAVVNRVIRGGNRECEVKVHLVCLYPDGQHKYEIDAVGHVTIPAGDPTPQFVVHGTAISSVKIPCEPVPSPEPEPEVPYWRPPSGGPGFEVRAHSVVRGPDGAIRSERTTEPIPLPAEMATPDCLVGVNTVVDARPTATLEDDPWSRTPA